MLAHSGPVVSVLEYGILDDDLLVLRMRCRGLHRGLDIYAGYSADQVNIDHCSTGHRDGGGRLSHLRHTNHWQVLAILK